MNHLNSNHWNCGGNSYTQTMTKKELKETLLQTEGFVLKNGAIHDVKSKHLGVGVYSVFLVERKYK